MEVSTAIYVKAQDELQGDFVYSLWDLLTQPLDVNDVEERFQAFYEEVEFLDEPDLHQRVSTTEMIAYYDVLSGMDCLEETCLPYLPYVEGLVYVIRGDEGNEWFKSSNGRLIGFTPSKHKQDADLLNAVKEVGRHAF